MSYSISFNEDYWKDQPYIGGIDPGKKGGLSLLDAKTGKIVEVFHVPLLPPKKKGSTKRAVDFDKLYSTWTELQNCRHIFFEYVWGAAPRGRSQGGAGMFNFGDVNGFVKGMIWTWGVPRTMILPAKWRKTVGMKANEADAKDQKVVKPSFDLARKLWPESKHLFERVTVDEGVCEASLIAYAGKLLLEQGTSK